MVDLLKGEGPVKFKEHIIVKVMTADACFIRSEEAFELNIEELELLRVMLKAMRQRQKQ